MTFLFVTVSASFAAGQVEVLHYWTSGGDDFLSLEIY